MKSKYLKKISALTITSFGIYLILGSISYSGSDAPAISLDNTNFVVSIAFVAFLGLLFYLKVPSKISGLLDDRSRSIEAEINNANLLLEESKTMLADLEREHKINIEKAKKILIDAEAEAKNILSEAKKEIRFGIERKVKLAEEQIKATEASVIKSIKNKAVDQSVLIAEAELLRKAKSKKDDFNIDQSLKDLEAGLKRL
tara:strand:- start:2081 stop:2680 length:600 start_codon:yes stop_codon:yes gene_type:complete